MLVVDQVRHSDGSVVSGPVGRYLVQDVADDGAKLLFDQFELAIVDLSLSVLPAAEAFHPIDLELEHKFLWVLFLGILFLELKLDADCAHGSREPLLLPSIHALGAAETKVDAVPQHLLGAADERLERGIGEVVLELAHGIDGVLDLLFAVVGVKGLLVLLWGLGQLSPKHLVYMLIWNKNGCILEVIGFRNIQLQRQDIYSPLLWKK